MTNKLEKYITLVMVLFAIGFNLWMYRLEPTAKIDPNDNPFQYALVDRTNQMWEYAGGKCGINLLCFTGYLVDHWVPNWAQGYNLPYYYSHVPQIAIVASYRLFGQFTGMSLFQWYHVLIYLLLCLFPLSVFAAFRILKTPLLISGAAALFASHISTDGLYGLDPSSFLWRGYGLTSQLFSMIWMPAAIAMAFRFFHAPLPKYTDLIPLGVRHVLLKGKRNDISPEGKTARRLFWSSVLLLVLTISGHLGLGVITLLSIGIIAISPLILDIFYQQSRITILNNAKMHIGKLILVASSTIFFLSYWIVPALVYDSYHNYSFWDPVWKFNSYGWKEVMQFFFNGALFDFGRMFPVLTMLIIIGAFAVVTKKQSTKEQPQSNPQLFTFFPFAFLFLFWLLMFFGRTTWGSLLDLIPSMKEFHQSRFIVGLHLAGFFLAPFGLWFLADYLPHGISTIKRLFTSGISSLKTTYTDHTSPYLLITSYLCVIILGVIASYPQTMRYSEYNDVLIKRGNENFDKQNPDVAKLIKTLREATPGRTFTGRGGSWGKKLEIAETTYFMHLSTYGIPVILWLPETWSPNSDVEQFFIEERPEHYDLLNVRYVVAPIDHEPLPFWQLTDQTPQWKLYEVKTNGYFGTGSRAATVFSSKFDFINLVRLWLQSDYPTNKIFPQLTFDRKAMMASSLPAFEMVDEASYKTRDGTLYGLFGDIPKYEAPKANLTTHQESSVSDMEFKTMVTVDSPCERCFVFLKQSFHPNWKAWVNGKRTDTFISFPFYTAVAVNSPGTHTIELKYEPGTLKMTLFTLALVTGIVLLFPWHKTKKSFA